MTLEFDQEVIRLNGCLVAGTVTVEADEDGLEAIAFEPEDGRKGLRWPDVEPACDAWRLENETRVQRVFDREAGLQNARL